MDLMEPEIIKIATAQGIWATLFVALLFYILRENSTREKNYQNIIQSLTNHLDILANLQEEVLDIKQDITDLKVSMKDK